ncbi:hypothetical protein LC20_08210 [Yersinia hibernica]|uniref:Uncharacterized protein n=1 Tax=Yersinia enterocolitica LC20 TaxID=1443113 RepID=A0A7U5SUH6_YEREN|nr:hypothetical protein LC20_08210 [Yersinia hibernica]
MLSEAARIGGVWLATRQQLGLNREQWGEGSNFRQEKTRLVLNLRRRDYRAPQYGDIKEKQWH